MQSLESLKCYGPRTIVELAVILLVIPILTKVRVCRRRRRVPRNRLGHVRFRSTDGAGSALTTRAESLKSQ